MSEQTANLCTTDACESLRQRLAKYEDAEGRPVVAGHLAVINKAYMALTGYLPGHRNAITDEAIEACRSALNSSPVGAPTYLAYTTTPGEAVAGIALRQLGDESRWVEIRDLNAHAFPDIGPHDYYPVGTELRLPALSAPSHGGGVAHTDCRSEDGITVGLIDSIITSCRVLSSRDLTCEAAVEALRDLRSDSDVSLIKPSHGEQVRAVVPEGFRVMKPTSAVVRYGDRWEIYAPCGSGGVVNEDDVTDWVVRMLLDAIAATPSAGSQGGDV